MGRLPKILGLAVMLVIPSVFALAPVAAACDDIVCAMDEESRQGDECGPQYGTPAHYFRYYNLTMNVGEVRIHSNSTFACKNQYVAHDESAWTNITVQTPGRTDQAYALYTYGDRCGAAAGVILDRILIFNNPSFGQGASRGCGETSLIPSVAEALP